MRKRKLLAIVLGLMMFGVVYASAASLGGLDTDNLGADDADVASCDAGGVTASWDVDFVDGAYEVVSVTISDIAAECVGGEMDVTLSDDSNGSLTEVSQTISLTSHTITVPAGVDAEDVEGIHVVIDGGTTQTNAT